MSSVFPAEDIIRDRAAYWAARLNDSDVTDVERAELHDWLLADTRHANEFRRTTHSLAWPTISPGTCGRA